MQNPNHLKEALGKEGAFAVGIAAASKLESQKERMVELCGEGFFADMDWLARTIDERTDPEKICGGAKSVIVTAWPYSKDIKAEHIARFARQKDYHKMIKERLERAWKIIFGDTAGAKAFVDSKPIAEKVFGMLSGIGWIGKNTLLINEKIGSFFCIGIILTDIEFERGEPVAERCGSCRKCIDGCPTGALSAPYRLDARKCISYLTVEKRGDVPEEMMPLIGEHVYGCDICQTACPYNQKTISTSLFPSIEGPLDSLKDILQMNEESFAETFKESGIKRLGYELFMRNAIIAAANQGDKKLLPVLSDCLQRRSPLIQKYAAWGINFINKAGE